jgi:tRNA-dihydrouridine synthase B
MEGCYPYRGHNLPIEHMPHPSLTTPFEIAGVHLRNRVILAPLAGIGNWFVRLQAHRYGAGLAVSEMVSSYALAHRNRRTTEEMLRIDPGEGPVSIQLFGPDPDVMREAAAIAAAAGPDLIDLNMGCPVPKVVKTGAGAALIGEPERAVAVARAAAEGSGLPVTVKLRSGLDPADRSGVELARRLAADAGVAAITMHPRSAKVHHSGRPEYELVSELASSLEIPVIVSGGARTAEAARQAYARSGAAAVMVARGSLGNPWIFEQLVGDRDCSPSREEVLSELAWIIDCGERHWGPERAARNLRKFYPWYLIHLQITGSEADGWQRTETLDEVRARIAELDLAPVGASL